MHEASRRIGVELLDASADPFAREVWRDGVDLNILKAKLCDRRRMIVRMVAVGALLFGLGAIVVAGLYDPPYSATTGLLISNTTLAVSGQDAAVTQIMADNSLLESEMELLTSGAVLDRVVDAMGLNAVEAALPPPSFPLASWLRGKTAADGGNAEAARRRTTIAALRASVIVKRLGASQILTVRAKSVTADGAVMLANEVARAFVAEEETINRLVTTSAAFRERIKMLGATARIINEASPPLAKDGPGRLTMFGVALLAGGFAGFALALAAVLRDRRVTAREQLGFLAPAEFLGSVPRLRAPALRGRRWPRFLRSSRTDRDHSPARWALEDLTPPLQRAQLAAEERFARATRVIAVTSCSSEEGVTTMASSFARLLASQNRRVVLIDANERKPDLSQSFAPGATLGLKQVLDGRVRYEDVVVTNIESNLEFLPSGEYDGNGQTYWSEIHRTVGDAGDSDTWLILDMPPIRQEIAVRAAADIIDGVLLVIARGRTTETSIKECQRLLGPARHKLFALLINDAPNDRASAARSGAAERGETSPGVSHPDDATDRESDFALATETDSRLNDTAPAWEEQ